ncbi:DNA polymerase III subunit psi [Entomohabitans teleogrylli]|uniref:DNA polymerase III subunit psi n=1 Tax=Entomohabitans teleogrylli TaxID=1384589 RepID=UPI00073DB22E|nr:DNA polymerase III subunit psi [Entomohabitans teleogrylli]
MASRRDWQLQQLGITRWILRRPAVLQGEIAIALPEHIRLVVVAQPAPALDNPLIGDVLRSMALTPDRVLPLTPDRVAMLPEKHRCNSWCLGVDVPLGLSGVRLVSPGLEELQHSGAARAALWRQICEHEQDIFATAG